jgi:hypothetical protein
MEDFPSNLGPSRSKSRLENCRFLERYLDFESLNLLGFWAKAQKRKRAKKERMT